jgi:DNA-binding GntR family transcriptional regulator
VTRELKSTRVANDLRKRIEAGEFPEGAKLIMSKLAVEYSVSSGTVCGALSDLGREDLVFLDYDGGGRWYVGAAKAAQA